MSRQTQFPLSIELALLHYSQKKSLSEIGKLHGMSKQAVQKRVHPVRNYFLNYDKPRLDPDEALSLKQKLSCANDQIEKLKALVRTLQLIIILKTASLTMLQFMEEQILKFFPHFKVKRLSPHQKLEILQLYKKYLRLNGELKQFAGAVGRTLDTLNNWAERFERYGLSGLQDKISRPKSFKTHISSELKQYLFQLFGKFPRWTPYQFAKYLKNSPATQQNISVAAINKLRDIYDRRKLADEIRQHKLWTFPFGVDVWTMDFTSVFKNDKFQMQLLTVSDTYSRYLFDMCIFIDPTTEQVMDHLKELFIAHGKPLMIKADNGQQFRMDCQDQLRELSVYLLNNPPYYGQFNGAHERIHRTLKTYIEPFSEHKNLFRLAEDVKKFHEHYNHDWPLEVLNNQTPADVYLNEIELDLGDREVVTPYIKDDELRMKFKDRDGTPARISLKQILPNAESTT